MNWIPVTKDLPGDAEHPGETCEMCIVTSKKYGVTVGWYNRLGPGRNINPVWYSLIWKLLEEDETATRDSMFRDDIPEIIIADKDDVVAWMPYPEEY